MNGQTGQCDETYHESDESDKKLDDLQVSLDILELHNV